MLVYLLNLDFPTCAVFWSEHLALSLVLIQFFLFCMYASVYTVVQKYDDLCDLTAFEEFISTLPSHLAT